MGKCVHLAGNDCCSSLFASHRNEYLIFQKIIKLEYDFPDKFFPKARDLVEKLLVNVSVLLPGGGGEAQALLILSDS